MEPVLDIHKTYHPPFKPVHICDAWLSPETVVPPVTRIEVSPEIGGFIQLIVEGDEAISTMTGWIEDLEPAKRLAYNWEWDEDGHRTLVTVELKPEAGSTRIEIAHTGFQNQHSFGNHDLGWDQYVAGIGRILPRHRQGS